MGNVKLVNGVIVKRISMFVTENQKDWDVHLPGTIFAIRFKNDSVNFH